MISEVGTCCKEVLDAWRDVVTYVGIPIDVGQLDVCITNGADAGLGFFREEDTLGVELLVYPPDECDDQPELGLSRLSVGSVLVEEGWVLIQEYILVPLTTRFQAVGDSTGESGKDFDPA